MNIRILGAFLAALTMSGCVVYSDGGGGTTPPPQYPGDVTFSWSFSGRGCFEVPDVNAIVLQIPGEILHNDGVYPCSANNFPGIVLHDFAPGTYSFTIDAYEYGSNPRRLFVGSGTFTVNGDVRVNVDLMPVGGPTSYAYLGWRLPPNQSSQNPTCTQAGVTTVLVSIDGSDWVAYDCELGRSAQGAVTWDLVPGLHDISLVAVNADNYAYYRFDGRLETFSGRPVDAFYNLQWAVGGAAISWQLTNGSLAQTCAQAGVQTVYVEFVDRDGYAMYGNGGDPQPCTATPVLYQYLPAGTYTVYLQGVGAGGVWYLSNENNPPTVTVTAGQFVDGSQPKVVQMFRE